MASKQEKATQIVEHINAIVALTLESDTETPAPSASLVAAIELEARPGLEDRSAGWKIEGLGVDGKPSLLLTTTKLKSREKTKIAVKPQPWQGMKITYPKDSYGNLKVRFLDANGQVLAGTPTGPAGSYGGNRNATFEQVFSADSDKFYDAANGNSGVLTYTFAPTPVALPTPQLAKPVAAVDPTTGTITVSYK